MKKKNFIIKYVYVILVALFSFNMCVYAADSISCAKLVKLQKDLQSLFNLIRIFVPLLVIGLSSYEFIKALTNKDASDSKKTFIRFLKRMIYAILLFFLPSLINVLIGFIIQDASVCVS